MLYSRVRWGAIFAGAFISLSSMVFFSLFALATGTEGVNVLLPLPATITLSAAIYSVGTSMIAFGLAGFCAVRLARLRDPGAACLHALTAFSMAGALVPFLFTRTLFLGAPGFALAPAPATFFSSGVGWTLFLSFTLAAVTCCAAGLQACYRMSDLNAVNLDEEEPRRPSVRSA